ncbi:unnamed protein product [Aphanomyces euteiches]
MSTVTAKTRCYYDVLKIPRTASQAEIVKAYRKLALKHHPDKLQNQSNVDLQAATEYFQTIVKAYDVLSDYEKRADYDIHGPKLKPSYDLDIKASLSKLTPLLASAFVGLLGGISLTQVLDTGLVLLLEVFLTAMFGAAACLPTKETPKPLMSISDFVVVGGMGLGVGNLVGYVGLQTTVYMARLIGLL